MFDILLIVDWKIWNLEVFELICEFLILVEEKIFKVKNKKENF